jgi:hypothetical protein
VANTGIAPTNLSAISKLSPWQLSSMNCLMRMTNMAIAGYIHEFKTRTVSNPNASITSERLYNLTKNTEAIKNEYMTFPLPQSSHRMKSRSRSHSFGSHTNPSPQFNDNELSNRYSNDRNDHNNILTYHDFETNVTVACIRFSKYQEVEILWIETCKTFADFSNQMPIEVSRNATFCLQVTII